MGDEDPTVELPAIYDRIFLGDLGEVAKLRASLAGWLNGCPVADDVELVASELAANAVLHSASKSLYFTVRAYLHPGHPGHHVRVEVEDLGGPWRCRPADDRPHGLDLVQMLSEDWGIEVRDCDSLRTTWARVSIPCACQTPKVSDEATRPRCAEQEVSQSA